MAKTCSSPGGQLAEFGILSSPLGCTQSSIFAGALTGCGLRAYDTPPSIKNAVSVGATRRLLTNPASRLTPSARARTFRSSPGVQRTFCESCGTPLTYSSQQRPGQVDITSVSLDDPETWPPDREVWLEEKLRWVEPDGRRQQFTAGGD